MYHFQNEHLYNTTYEQFIQEKCPDDLSNQHIQTTEYLPVAERNAVETNIWHSALSDPPQVSLEVKAKPKHVKRPSPRDLLDTSSFSVEERLVAAVWVHERKRTNTSISQIKNNFRERFGREPPAKNTLLVWERKLFTSGSVHDAPRTGRPVNRRSRINEVAASLSSAPSLSVRARAATLRMPVTTLRTILYKDLQHIRVKNKDSVVNKGRPAEPRDDVKKHQPPTRAGPSPGLRSARGRAPCVHLNGFHNWRCWRPAPTVRSLTCSQ